MFWNEKYWIEAKEQWHKHKPEVITKNDKCKILRDFAVQLNHEIYRRRPDIIVVQKDKTRSQIMHFGCPYDRRVDTKELEKIEDYQDLTQESRNK